MFQWDQLVTWVQVQLTHFKSKFERKKKKATEKVTDKIEASVEELEAKVLADTVDWGDPEAYITTHFKVKEALQLQQWGILHKPSKEEKLEIVKMALKMERVRSLLGGWPLIITSWIRPTKADCKGSEYHGKNYNEQVGGAPASVHITGGAVDFVSSEFPGVEGCNTVREALLPHLEELGIRMEDHKGNWVHVDIAPVKYNRFFKP